MHKIPVRIELESTEHYEILFNDQLILSQSGAMAEFELDVSEHHFSNLMIRGSVRIDRLILDGIDTEYFVHHGFNPKGQRGNQSTEWVGYYFRAPIWKWYIEWKQHDNSPFREISKNHSGFLPL